MLQGKLVALEIVDSVGRETVRRTLENDVKPRRKRCWCMPRKANAEFVCAMEDVPETDRRDFTGDEVFVCLDETAKQRTKETRHPILAPEAQPARVGAAGPGGLRACVQWRRQPVHGVRSMARFPPDGDHRLPHPDRPGATDPEACG